MDTATTNGTEKRSGGDHRKTTNHDAKQQEQIDRLIKSLGNLQTPEQKIAALAKSVIDGDRQTSALKMNEKQMESILREKEHLQKEYNKGVLMRNKLEQVCREQQKLMKSIKSESMSKIKEEEEKRKETQARFQQSINEIFVTLGKNNEENAKLKDANAEMTKKFKFLAEQYDVRERQLEKIHEQINLETQLNEAKLAKIKMETTIEREILLKEKEAALEDLLTARTTVVEMQGREKILKGQLNLYTEKYEDFQNSLQKSNDIFSTYKAEIDKLAKKTKFLEKECYEWRVKFEKSNKAILVMATDKQAQDQYMCKAARQLTQLQKLCRTLQAERTSLLEVLKTNNIDRPPLPDLPPEPTDIEPPPKSADKLDIMSRNCLEMKKTLAELQGQMNALTTEKTKTDDNSAAAAVSTTSVAPPTKKPSSKSKKSKSKTCPMKERRANATAAAVPPPMATTEKMSQPPPVKLSAVETNKIEQLAERIVSNGNGLDGGGSTAIENGRVDGETPDTDCTEKIDDTKSTPADVSANETIANNDTAVIVELAAEQIEGNCVDLNTIATDDVTTIVAIDNECILPADNLPLESSVQTVVST